MSRCQSNIQWVGVDWGTTNLRAYALDCNNELVESIESDNGMDSIPRNGFEPALTQFIEPWLFEHRRTVVVMSGMVGARQGWVEAAYRDTPCAATRSMELTKVSTQDRRVSVYIVPGVCQKAPADVMRGEETQIFGYLSNHNTFNGVICLPGTHSKWVCVSDSKIQRFRTWMTGELYALLSSRSVLRHSTRTDSWDETAFMDAAKVSLESMDDPMGNLFSVRANDLLHGACAAQSKAALSGLLIGAECSAALKWCGQTAHTPIALVGEGQLTQLYASVLTLAGMQSEVVDSASATLSGLQLAANSVFLENSNA